MMAAMRRAATAMAATVALLAAGCGGATYHGEAARVDTAVKDFDAAERAGHGTVVCRDLFTPRFRHAVAGTVKQCAALERRALKIKRIDDVKVAGRRASTEIETADQSKGTVRLVSRRGHWLIDTIDWTSLGS
jgi:hypothetical protein